MEDKKYFHVESKSFDLIREAGINGLCIIERGKKFMSSIVLDKEGAMWFMYLMAKATNTSLEEQLLKTCREANKVFVCKKQQNERGRFVSLKEFGVSRNKGFPVIPKGRDLWRWQGFSQVLARLLEPRRSRAHVTKNTEPRLRPPQGHDRSSDDHLSL